MKNDTPEQPPKFKKPKVKLTGSDGNVFALAGKVNRALKDAGNREAAAEFSMKIMACRSYNDALVLMMEYVEVS